MAKVVSALSEAKTAHDPPPPPPPPFFLGKKRRLQLMCVGATGPHE